MRKHAKCTVLWLFLLVVTAVISLSQTANQTSPLIGKWKLNPQKSKLVFNLPPRDLVRTYEDRGGGVYIFTQEGRSANGTKMFSMYVAKDDGKEYPLVVQGADELASITVKAVDAYNAEQTEKHGGATFSTATRSISKDGKTMTLTVKLNGGEAGGLSEVMVFDKQ